MLSKKLAIKDVASKIKGKKVLIRVDFNVPMKDGKITDFTRIEESLKTINFVKENGAKSITLMSHLGNPKVYDNVKNMKLSLKNVVSDVSKLLKQDVQFLDDCVGDNVQQTVAKADGGKIMLLENLRFHSSEEGVIYDSTGAKKGKESKEKIEAFRAELTRLGDIYVNDAFGTSHRAHSSIVGCKQDIRCAGFLLKKELDFFSKVLENPEKPLTVIMGGAKVKDKTNIITNLLDKVNKMIIVGGMTYTFLKAMNPQFEIGKSLYDAEGASLVPSIIEKAKKNNVEMIFPIDFICASQLHGKVEDNKYSMGTIPKDLIGIDVGPKSMELINNAIKASKTIFLNGSCGVFESEAGRAGSLEMMKAIIETTKKGTVSVCGGGDTVNLVNLVPGAKNVMSHISTGGGASLELIEGKILPGVEALCNI